MEILLGHHDPLSEEVLKDSDAILLWHQHPIESKSINKKETVDLVSSIFLHTLLHIVQWRCGFTTSVQYLGLLSQSFRGVLHTKLITKLVSQPRLNWPNVCH